MLSLLIINIKKYLASCVVLASITHTSPNGINYNYFGEINETEKMFLQDIAHQTVENFFNIKLQTLKQY